MHTIEVFGGKGAARDRMDVLLRRKKGNRYNKGMVFKVVPLDEVPEWIRKELEAEEKQLQGHGAAGVQEETPGGSDDDNSRGDDGTDQESAAALSQMGGIGPDSANDMLPNLEIVQGQI